MRTARHSSGLRWSGYDVILLDEAEEPNKAPRKGIDGMDFTVGVARRGARKVRGCVKFERVCRMRKSLERMRVTCGGDNAENLGIRRDVYMFKKRWAALSRSEC